MYDYVVIPSCMLIHFIFPIVDIYLLNLTCGLTPFVMYTNYQCSSMHKSIA